jgi:fatty acid synthase, animal type
MLVVAKLQSMYEEQQLASDPHRKNSVVASINNVESNPTQAMDMDKTLVRLNNVKCGPTLFLLHGAGGGVLVMAKLAQMLKCTVYGVQDTPAAPLTGTLDRLSRFYLEKIKEKQPEGPYLLAGFSFGNGIFPALMISVLILRLCDRYLPRREHCANAAGDW